MMLNSSTLEPDLTSPTPLLTNILDRFLKDSMFYWQFTHKDIASLTQGFHSCFHVDTHVSRSAYQKPLIRSNPKLKIESIGFQLIDITVC